jgi:hypothetical protein
VQAVWKGDANVRLSEVTGGGERQTVVKLTQQFLLLIASSFVTGTFFRLSANFIPTFLNQLTNCLIPTSMKEASVTANDYSQ